MPCQKIAKSEKWKGKQEQNSMKTSQRFLKWNIISSRLNEVVLRTVSSQFIYRWIGFKWMQKQTKKLKIVSLSYKIVKARYGTAKLFSVSHRIFCNKVKRKNKAEKGDNEGIFITEYQMPHSTELITRYKHAQLKYNGGIRTCWIADGNKYTSRRKVLIIFIHICVYAYNLIILQINVYITVINTLTPHVS